MKYYAVKEGRQTGIFMSWDECRVQTDGFSGAKFKSFKSLEDANEYLSFDPQKVLETPLKQLDSEEIKKSDLIEETIKKQSNKRKVIAYVDGSYSPNKGKYGYAGIMQDSETQEFIKVFSDFGSKAKYLNARNVAGELLGAKMAIEYAISSNYEEIELIYDFSGIKDIAEQEAKNVKDGVMKSYYNYINSVKNKIKISYTKVKAHSGDTFNSLVDLLAKNEACN